LQYFHTITTTFSYTVIIMCYNFFYYLVEYNIYFQLSYPAYDTHKICMDFNTFEYGWELLLRIHRSYVGLMCLHCTSAYKIKGNVTPIKLLYKTCKSLLQWAPCGTLTMSALRNSDVCLDIGQPMKADDVAREIKVKTICGPNLNLRANLSTSINI